jgi:CRP-like cAMP-binding protein
MFTCSQAIEEDDVMEGERPDHVAIDADDWAVVRRSALFREVSTQALARLCGDRHAMRYAPRQAIFAQGDPADALFVVLEGWVKIYRLTPLGEETVVAMFTSAESFAEAAFFLGGAYPVNAEAASELRVLKIDNVRFQREMAADSGLAMALLSSLGRHAEQLFGEIASLKLFSAPRRLAEFLLRSAPIDARELQFLLPYEKTLLAGRLGMTPETLSRALAALKAFGVVASRELVVIPDVPALRAFAHGRLEEAG